MVVASLVRQELSVTELHVTIVNLRANKDVTLLTITHDLQEIVQADPVELSPYDLTRGRITYRYK